MDLLAIWGAGLSTLLAGVKLWELWRNHFRVETSYNLTSLPEEGHEIYIRNLNNRPITLEHWELEWRRGRWSSKKASLIEMAEDLSAGRRIEAYDSTTLRFVNQYYFSLRPVSEGKHLYIKLHFVGKKRPIKIKVYPD
ncbi:hypothetical protein ACK317_05240 [Aeromonas dhakensis]|uniref:hypothetical protein n=1 Tax=Aeromonas dhakensis TaxID=196024 RepID=UPI001BD03F87|nr:hypothetical protein [Aeromonas dhakensis]MBS4715178.1 hypothetical protein [Aeromonas dhakensis]BED99556.1 hypothetical protein VAWG001_11710 [Aeromonas dhakensis]HDZ8966029.1 hypothetical protein [Aeromonas dhakensis]